MQGDSPESGVGRSRRGAARGGTTSKFVPTEVAVAATTLLVDAAAAEVVAALREEGIESILLKGPSIAQALYPHGGARGYSDVDLLVEPSLVDRAGEVLRRLGFQPERKTVISGRVEHHADAWERLGDNAQVDVHRMLPWVGVPPRDCWDVLAGETQRIRVGGADIDVLAPPALAVHIALHAVFHGATVGGPVHDLELAIERWDGAVWWRARAVAERLGVLAGLRAGLAMASNGASLADELRLPTSVPPEIALSARGPRGAVELERLLAHRSWHDRARLVARQAIPPKAFMYAWWPRAGRGSGWLLLAYARRLWWIVTRIVPAVVAYRAARRSRLR